MATGRAVATAVAISLLLIGGPSARAGDDPLDIVGGACVPDSATVLARRVRDARIRRRVQRKQHRKDQVLCPFNATFNMIGKKVGTIFLNVIDDDGMETGARIRATFRHAALASNVAVTAGTCDSNTSSFPGPHNVSCTFPRTPSRSTSLTGGTCSSNAPIPASTSSSSPSGCAERRSSLLCVVVGCSRRGHIGAALAPMTTRSARWPGAPRMAMRSYREGAD